MGGTGVRAPGATAITPLVKSVDSIVQDNYTVVLPMRLTTGGQQTTFIVRLGKDAEEAKGKTRASEDGKAQPPAKKAKKAEKVEKVERTEKVDKKKGADEKVAK